MNQHLSFNLNGKVIFFVFLVIVEVIIGVFSSLSPEYTILFVCTLIILSCVVLLDPKLIFPMIFFVYPLSYFQIKIGIEHMGFRPIHFFVPALVIAVFLRVVANKAVINLQRTALDIPIMSFLLLATLSVFWSPQKSYALLILIQVIFAIVAYYLAVSLIKSREDIYRCLWVYFVVILILMVVSFLQRMGLESIGQFEPRGFHGQMTSYGSLTSRAQELAFHLVSGILLAMTLASIAKRGLKKYLIYLSVPFMILALYYTTSRTHYVAFAVTFLAFFFSSMKKEHLFFYTVAGFLAAGLLGFLYITQFEQKSSLWFLGSVFKSATWDPDETRNVMAFRYILWGISYTIFRDNMFFGAGIGSFPSKFREYHTGFPKEEFFFPQNSTPQPHSLYFDILVDLGIIGLVLFMVIIYYLLKNLIVTFIKFKDTADAKLLRFFILLLINILISGMTGWLKDYVSIWLNLGLVTVACLIITRSYQEQGASDSSSQ